MFKKYFLKSVVQSKAMFKNKSQGFLENIQGRRSTFEKYDQCILEQHIPKPGSTDG